MNKRGWLVVVLLLLAVGWWTSPLTFGPASIPAHVDDTSIDCRLPPRVADDAPPLQSPVPGSQQPFRLQAATLTPLAGFSVQARVLSREDYRRGREAELSPTDLALGWGRMRDDAVLARLDISQGGRWYRYRWQGQPPLPPAEIVRSSANMHLIPATIEVAETLQDVRENDRVLIQGWLVEARAADGWRWRSSTSRDDSGDGACEVIYVCALQRL